MVLYRRIKAIDVEKQGFFSVRGMTITEITKIIIDNRWPVFMGTWWQPWTWRVGWSWEVHVAFASDPREAG